ncbi:Cqd2 protein [Saccharomycopsis crataegensis]|uniref:Cqd2 protein n=1 Tax=Saccharomycopsis crataegensis TaxID=43959 RepID=A0AAV5QVH8_9ASCO|nr:Cqd2 protein [Saccharomycopsis crataegensis]
MIGRTRLFSRKIFALGESNLLLRQHPRLSCANRRGFASGPPSSYKGQNDNKKKRIFTTKVIPGLIITAAAYAAIDDDFRSGCVHVFKMMKRTGIVGVATVKCFSKYKAVLSKEYSSEEERNKALSKCHAECAHITYEALAHNGGIYIKLGQHVTALTYLLPPEWPEAMLPLLDQCPRSSREEINQLFIDDLGKPIDEIFETFDQDPFGVASLAQVHVATLKDTKQQVAVKCQHPSLNEFVPLDLLLTNGVFSALRRIFPEYNLSWLGDELQRGIYIELDFNIEAENSKNTREYFSNFKNITALRIPDITWSSKRILIMEFLPGRRLDDLKYLDDNNISRAQVSTCLAHTFNNMIFTPGVGIHCDPHGGNLAIRALPKSESHNGHNFEIILYDHGQYRHVTTEMRRSYAKMWLALLDCKPQEVKKYAKEFAGVTEAEFPIFAAAITGRDFDHAVGDLRSKRTQAEIDNMAAKFREEDLLIVLMELLSHLPRIVPLILKTNDLVRNLDERLENPLGMEKGFLVMASYCAQTVFYEDKQVLNEKYSKFSVRWVLGYLKALWRYEERIGQLYIYDIAVTMQQLRERLYGYLCF